MPAASRAAAARESRRASQFAKFRLVQLNLIPLVDVFTALVFFTLLTMTSATVPVAEGVVLPEARVGTEAVEQLTIGIGSRPAQVTLGGRPVMTVQEAATAPSTIPGQPLIIPRLLGLLQQNADSIRQRGNIAANEPVPVQLAIHADRTMRYDLLARVMHTARQAGFRNISLQVLRARDEAAGSAQQAD